MALNHNDLFTFFFATSFFVVLPVARLGSTHSHTGRQLLQGTLDYDQEGGKINTKRVTFNYGVAKGFYRLLK